MTKPERQYYAGAVLFVVVWSVADFVAGSIAHGLGVLIGNALWPAVIGGGYWLLRGRVATGGATRTAKIAFWCALLIPPILRTARP